MLRQGFAVDSCDYDGRTALMLAAAKGNEDVIHSLLAAGCDPQVRPTHFVVLDATRPFVISVGTVSTTTTSQPCRRSSMAACRWVADVRGAWSLRSCLTTWATRSCTRPARAHMTA